MKKFEFKTVVTLEVPTIVVASSEEEAREKLKSVLSHTMENEVKAVRIEDVQENTSLESVSDIPTHFTSEHNTLLEMGYPIQMVQGYSREDAEEEISSALSLV